MDFLFPKLLHPLRFYSPLSFILPSTHSPHPPQTPTHKPSPHPNFSPSAKTFLILTLPHTLKHFLYKTPSKKQSPYTKSPTKKVAHRLYSPTISPLSNPHPQPLSKNLCLSPKILIYLGNYANYISNIALPTYLKQRSYETKRTIHCTP